MADLQRYIDDGDQESSNLEYKAADSLKKANKERSEITKDVSAMANAAGGIIIYGIAEYQDKAREHLPEKLDPVDRTVISREWLEQVINNIRPRIDGIQIHSVQLGSGSNHVAYVVEVPQATTAHQAKDHRYYRRYNFQVLAMEDHEIRDVMGRNRHPEMELSFWIEITEHEDMSASLYRSVTFSAPPFRRKPPEMFTAYTLKVKARNTGTVYAKYVSAFFTLPKRLDYVRRPIRGSNEYIEIDGQLFFERYRDNTVRDVVKAEYFGPDERGPARYEPILPNLALTWEFRLGEDFESVDMEGRTIHWEVYADNAPARSGQVLVSDIEVQRPTRH